MLRKLLIVMLVLLLAPMVLHGQEIGILTTTLVLENKDTTGHGITSAYGYGETLMDSSTYRFNPTNFYTNGADSAFIIVLLELDTTDVPAGYRDGMRSIIPEMAMNIRPNTFRKDTTIEGSYRAAVGGADNDSIKSSDQNGVVRAFKFLMPPTYSDFTLRIRTTVNDTDAACASKYSTATVTRSLDVRVYIQYPKTTKQYK